MRFSISVGRFLVPLLVNLVDMIRNTNIVAVLLFGGNLSSTQPPGEAIAVHIVAIAIDKAKRRMVGRRRAAAPWCCVKEDIHLVLGKTGTVACGTNTLQASLTTA